MQCCKSGMIYSGSSYDFWRVPDPAKSSGSNSNYFYNVGNFKKCLIFNQKDESTNWYGTYQFKGTFHGIFSFFCTYNKSKKNQILIDYLFVFPFFLDPNSKQLIPIQPDPDSQHWFYGLLSTVSTYPRDCAACSSTERRKFQGSFWFQTQPRIPGCGTDNSCSQYLLGAARSGPGLRNAQVRYEDASNFNN